MELYNSENMPLSNNPQLRAVQEKIINGEQLTISDKRIAGRDHPIKEIYGYQLKPDHAYRAVSYELYEMYKANGMIIGLEENEKLEYDYIIVDEFAREARYYEYLRDVENVQRNITFITKAEDKNLAVAAGSIISRYIFLKEFDKLWEELNRTEDKAVKRAYFEEIRDRFNRYT